MLYFSRVLGGLVASSSLLFLSLSPSSPSLLLPLRPATMRLLGFVLVEAMLAAKLAVSKVGLHSGFVQYL